MNKPNVQVSAKQPSAQAPEYDLKCGCAIEEIGHCGNYVILDSQPYPLKLPVDLGKMPFCGRPGLHAHMDGSLVNGQFEATTFAYSE